MTGFTVVFSTAADKDVQLEEFVATGTDLPYLFCVPILLKDNYDALDGKTAHCLHDKMNGRPYGHCLAGAGS